MVWWFWGILGRVVLCNWAWGKISWLGLDAYRLSEGLGSSGETKPRDGWISRRRLWLVDF